MKSLMLILMCTCAVTANSQNLVFTYNQSQVGKNLRLGYEFSLVPNLFLEPGLKYIVWTGVNDNEGHFFKHRFRPINLTEHFGVYSNFKYRIINTEYIDFLVLYSGALSYTHLITDGPTHTGQYAYDSINNQYYDVLRDIFQVRPKTLAFENYISTELDFNLSKKVKGLLQIGIGYTFYYIDDDPNFITLQKSLGEPSWFFGTIGFKYNLSGRNKLNSNDM
jgi:hypothetical protein